MKIILDTNLIKECFLCNSKSFLALKDFIVKTKSEIVFPEVILWEIEYHYKELLLNIYKKYESVKKGHYLYYSEDTEFPEITDPEQEVKNYIGWMLKELLVNDGGIITSPNEILPDLLNRLAFKIKPCSVSKQECKDAVIWLTIMEKYRESEEDIVFITHNSSDFFNVDKQELHPILNKDVVENKVNLSIFFNLEEFIKEHGSKIDFITIEWINENIFYERIREAHKEFISDISMVYDYIHSKVDDHVQKIDGIPYIHYDPPEVFFIYQMNEDKFTLYVDFKGSMKVVYSTMVYTMVPRMRFNGRNWDVEPDMDWDQELDSRYVNFNLTCAMDVEGRRITDYEVVSCRLI